MDWHKIGEIISFIIAGSILNLLSYFSHKKRKKKIVDKEHEIDNKLVEFQSKLDDKTK